MAQVFRNLSFVLLTLYLLIGCGDEKELEKQHPEPSRNLLEKTRHLEAWGLKTEALRFYQHLAFSDFPSDVRGQALENWISLLEKENQTSTWLKMKTELLEAIPEKNTFIWNKLFSYYMNEWQWKFAFEALKKIEEKDILNSTQKKEYRRLDQLQKRTLLWSETFDQLSPAWCLASPYFYKLDSLKRVLKVNNISPSWYHAGYHFYWTGKDTLFAFDIIIHDMDMDAEINFGLFQNPGTKQQDYLGIQFLLRGEPEKPLRRLAFRGVNAQEISSPKEQGEAEFRLEVWYHVTFDYLPSKKQTRLVVRDKESGEKVFQSTLSLGTFFTPGDYFFGFYNHFSFSHSRYQGTASADNLSLYSKPGDIKEAENLLSLQKMYQVNLRAAQEKHQEVREFYRRMELPYWQVMEIRAMNHLHHNEIPHYLRDLNKLIKSYPDHPNAAYFRNEIVQWEKNR